MKVHYTGAHAEFTPAQQKTIDTEFAKLRKLLDKRGDKEAHVIFTHERHLTKAEITVHYYGHPLVAASSDANPGKAMIAALKKFETQLIKAQSKWRDLKIRPAKKVAGTARVEAVEPAPKIPAVRIRKVTLRKGRKPMTPEEAAMTLDGQGGYLLFQDADGGGLSVLIARDDGGFDLVESAR